MIIPFINGQATGSEDWGEQSTFGWSAGIKRRNSQVFLVQNLYPTSFYKLAYSSLIELITREVEEELLCIEILQSIKNT
jgi:hypothetical protein